MCSIFAFLFPSVTFVCMHMEHFIIHSRLVVTSLCERRLVLSIITGKDNSKHKRLDISPMVPTTPVMDFPSFMAFMIEL